MKQVICQSGLILLKGNFSSEIRRRGRKNEICQLGKQFNSRNLSSLYFFLTAREKNFMKKFGKE